jgi:hypothetical protein
MQANGASTRSQSSSRRNDWVRFYIKLLAIMFGAIVWMLGLIFTSKLWQSFLTPTLIQGFKEILLVTMAGSLMALMVVAVLLMFQRIKPASANIR